MDGSHKPSDPKIRAEHRQPGKPELAAGTIETLQRCCNVGRKGLLGQGPTAAHPSQDSQAWLAESRGAAGKAQVCVFLPRSLGCLGPEIRPCNLRLKKLLRPTADI